MVLAFILDLFGIVEMKGQGLDLFVNFGSLIFTPVIIDLNLIIFKITSRTLLLFIPSACMIVCFILIVFRLGLLGYWFSVGTYETQTILYESTYCSCKTIEFQMQDIGALGYNRRYVEVTYLTPWFMITEEIDPDKKRGKEWIRVDKDVNELNLKY